MKLTLDKIQSNLDSERGFDQLLGVDGQYITDTFKVVIVPAVEDFKRRIKQCLDGGDNDFRDFNHWLLALNGGETAKKHSIPFRYDSCAPLYEFTELLKNSSVIADDFFESLNPELDTIGYRVAIDDAINSVKNVKAIRAGENISNIENITYQPNGVNPGLGWTNIKWRMDGFSRGYSSTWASEEILLPENLGKLTFDGVYKGMGFTEAECKRIYNHYLSTIKPQIEKKRKENSI